MYTRGSARSPVSRSIPLRADICDKRRRCVHRHKHDNGRGADSAIENMRKQCGKYKKDGGKVCYGAQLILFFLSLLFLAQPLCEDSRAFFRLGGIKPLNRIRARICSPPAPGSARTIYHSVCRSYVGLLQPVLIRYHGNDRISVGLRAPPPGASMVTAVTLSP